MAKLKVTGPESIGREIEAQDGASLLKVLEDHGYEVPHLCYHEAVSAYGACRLCLVEVEKRGKRKLTTSCNYPVQDGIEVHLDTEAVRTNRKMVLELLMGMAPGVPALQELAGRYGLKQDQVRYEGGDDACILCGLCERICAEAVGANAITFANRGDRKELVPAFGMADDCIGCASCAHVCPTGYITYSDASTSRTIWERQFEMLCCSECGKPLITEAQRDHLVATKRMSSDYFDRCDACKRPELAQSFATVGK